MRTIPLIVAIVNVSGCAECRQWQRPIVRNDDLAPFSAHRRGESPEPVVKAPAVGKTPTPSGAEPQQAAAKEPEVYNSPTLWQSFKSIHMAQKKKVPAARKPHAAGGR